LNKNIYFIFAIFLLSSHVGANQLVDFTSALGVSKDDLKNIWFGARCEPDWSMTIEKSTFEDESLLGYIAVQSSFFSAKESNGKIVLSPGKKCIALNDYYFKKIESEVIGEFIEKDKAFTKNYGFSVLDAIFIERCEYFSINGKVSSFKLRHAESLKEKGIFTITEENSTFNGTPSKAYSGKITEKGKDFHTRVFGTK
jgi:hypothetical protein